MWSPNRANIATAPSNDSNEGANYHLPGVEGAFMCVTCGVQYAPSELPPSCCKICEDDRQFVARQGQMWTTQEKLEKSCHRNCFSLIEGNLYGIGTVPKFGIGQRALLVKTTEGNLLWDCISFLDQATIDIVKALGGLKAIAISHPHYYASSIQWSTAFGNIPIYIHSRDEKWICWSHTNIVLWEGERNLLFGGLSLVHLGGHFAGAQVLLWPGGAQGKGSLLTGDILQVGADRKSVSVMRSYPNFIPLSAAQVRRIQGKLCGLTYDRVHGAFWDYVIEKDAMASVAASLERYLDWLERDDVMA